MPAAPTLESRKLAKTRYPGIYKRGGRYVVVFRDRRGKQVKRAARTLAEARDLQAQLKADVSRGEYRSRARITFAEYADTWIETFQGRTSRGLRPETRAEYKADLKRDATPYFGSMLLAEIEPQDVKAYATMLAAAGKKPGTVRNALAPVRALLATAVEEGLIRSNPAAGLRIAQRTDTEDDKARALTEKQLRKLITKTPTEWRMLIRFLAATGLRISEALALTWGDIDLDTRRVRVNKRVRAGNVAPPKSRYANRTIPLSEEMTLAVRQHRNEAGDPPNDALVFPSSAGTHLDQTNLFKRVMKPAAKAAKVDWAGFHTLRHTCATMLFRNGLNAKQAQLWLGHHSPAFTLERYVHLLPDDLPDPTFLDPILNGKGGQHTGQHEQPRVTENGKTPNHQEMTD